MGYTLRSGNDTGLDLRCYDCGARFLPEGSNLPKELGAVVVCPDCGRRHAVVVSDD